jgi:hypothetical protein
MNKMLMAIAISACLIGYAQAMHRTQSEEDLHKALAASLAETRPLTEEEQLQKALEASSQEAREKEQAAHVGEEKDLQATLRLSKVMEAIDAFGKSLIESGAIRSTPHGELVTASGIPLGQMKQPVWVRFSGEKQAEAQEALQK